MAPAMTRCGHAGSGHLQPERCPHAKEAEHGWLRAPFLGMAAPGHFACQKDGCPVGTEPALRLPSACPGRQPAPHALPGSLRHTQPGQPTAQGGRGTAPPGGQRHPLPSAGAKREDGRERGASRDGGRVRDGAARNGGGAREETPRNGGRTREGCHVVWLREGRGTV